MYYKAFHVGNVGKEREYFKRVGETACLFYAAVYFEREYGACAGRE